MDCRIDHVQHKDLCDKDRNAPVPCVGCVPSNNERKRTHERIRVTRNLSPRNPFIFASLFHGSAVQIEIPSLERTQQTDVNFLFVWKFGDRVSGIVDLSSFYTRSD